MSQEVEPGATGRSGKRGNEVFWTHPTQPGIIIARAISAKIAKLDEARKPHAVAFGSICHLSQRMVKAIRLGFPKNAVGQKGANLFTKINMKNAVAEGIQTDPNTPVSMNKKAPEEFHARIHYDRLLVAQGSLEEPEVTLTIDKETRIATFTQESKIIEGAINEKNDRVYAVIYDTVAESCIIRELRQRGENGVTTILLPERYAPDNLAIYSFATTYRGDVASNSHCLASPTENEE